MSEIDYIAMFTYSNKVRKKNASPWNAIITEKMKSMAQQIMKPLEMNGQWQITLPPYVILRDAIS